MIDHEGERIEEPLRSIGAAPTRSAEALPRLVKERSGAMWLYRVD